MEGVSAYKGFTKEKSEINLNMFWNDRSGEHLLHYMEYMEQYVEIKL